MDEFIKSLEWYHLTFLFSVMFIVVFRTSIAGLISRITAIDKSGVKTTPEPSIQREEKNEKAVQDLLVAIGETVVLTEMEDRIRLDLEDKGLEIKGDTIQVLVKYLAASQILTEFEQIYNLIFGSQIFLLKKLNEVTGQGKLEEYLRSHFEQVKELFPDVFGTWNMAQYLGFLIERFLILKQGEIYHITNLGVEFLTWMARNSKSENRDL